VVSCDVFEERLDAKPSFDALSYTWDLDPEWDTFKFDFVRDKKKEERPILCNGKTHHVTMNLYHALTELRRRHWPLPIWADQICIDQNNSTEKNAQLAIMIDIYRSAACVNIWLGKSTMVLNNAVDFMESLPEEAINNAQVALTSAPTTSASAPAPAPASVPAENKNAIMNSFGGIADAKVVKGTIGGITNAFDGMSLVMGSLSDQYHWFNAVRVIGRQWFARAWTLQEFLVAPKFRFLIGHRDISIQAFVRTATRLIEFYTTDPFSTQLGLNVTFLSIRKYIQGRVTLLEERDKYWNGKRYSAEEYLGVIRVRRATEMKDKVIAGMALLDECASYPIDYAATTQEIFTTFATKSLWPEVGVFALSLVGGTKPHVEGLPSWAPDLSNPLRPEPLRYCGCPTFESKVVVQNHQEFNIDGKSLRIAVAEWGVVKEVGESIWSWTKYDEEAYNSDDRFTMRTSGTSQSERFGLMFALLNNIGAVYAPTGERTMDAFWQTLIGGINLKDEAGQAAWRERFQQWFAFILLSIRSAFFEEKKNSENRFIPKATKKKWLVPLIADWPTLEQRVLSFLDFHDQELNDADDSNLTLRKTIGHIAKKLWGTDAIDDVGSWNRSMSELLSAVRGQQFYGPISVFGQHFETVYDGRRIFSTEHGYLGTGAEDVRAGDLVVLVAGANVPYILRPNTGKEQTYTLVSEAYVHGIMSTGSSLKSAEDFKSVTLE
jgi:hypothetical protein